MTVSLVCGVCMALVPEGRRKWIRMISGLIMTITVLAPLSDLLGADLPVVDPELIQAGESLRTEGEAISRNAMADIIIRNTQAYILDKANEQGASLSAEVTVSDDTIPVPEAVTLRGTISPYSKLRLEGIIETELGITKENIRWME